MERSEPSLVGRLLRMTALVEDALLVLILAAMVGLAATQIILRNLFDGAILWADPMLRVGVLWVGMIGAMVATRSDKQISVDAVSQFLPARWKAGDRAPVCVRQLWRPMTEPDRARAEHDRWRFLQSLPCASSDAPT